MRLMKTKPSIITLLALMPFASIAAVLFTPALPAIALWFHISESAAGSAMSLFLLGYALGNLPYGPLAKRYGRKGAIYCGIGMTIFSCGLILIAGHYHLWNLFLIGRFLSALGSSVGMKIAFTIIADVFNKEEATKKVAIATLAFATAPSLAIALGGYLTASFGWQSCFYALIAYSISLLTLSLFLRETAPSLDPQALKPAHIMNGYQRKFKNRTLVYCGLILGGVTSITYLFSTIAPFLAINRLHVSPQHYGLMNCIPPLGLIGGSFASHWLASRRSKLSAIALGSTISLAASALMLMLFLTGAISLWTLFIPISLIYFGTSLIFSNASSFAMDHIQDKSNGSAVMGFINLLVATSAVLIAESLHSPHPTLLPLLFIALSVCIIIIHRRLKP